MKKFTKLIILCIVILISCLLIFIPTLKNINFGLDLQGGFEILYKVEPLVDGEELTKNDLNNTYKAIVNRIDTLGVSEPVITIEGNNTFRVQLPGVKDEKEAKEIISTIGLLSFRDTNDNLLMTSEILGKNGASADTNSETLKPIVKLDIKDSNKFYNVTKEISTSSDNRIVIWLDYDSSTDSFASQEDTCGENENNKCLSAAYVSEGLNSSSVIIEGNFTKEKVERLVDLINAGSLPTKLVEDSTPHSVNASFGYKTIEKCGIAGIITILFISILLIFRYRFCGLISSISLILYSLLIFLIFNGLKGVLTLPGIAALILGIGMAVDSAIISIERIKEEYNNNNLSEAYKNGTKRSLSAILDANITTFIIALILYIFGESTIKGFATMLIISIIVTIISMVIINRILIKLAVNSDYFKNKPACLFGVKKETPKFNFKTSNKYALITFIIIFIAGIVFYFVNGINLGVDFSGGTSINMTSNEKIDLDKVETILKDYDLQEYNYYMGSEKEAYAKLNNIVDDAGTEKITTELKSLGIDTSINEISTMVVENLTKNAIYSLLISFIAIIIYIAIRFNFNFGISGLAALIHDVVLIIITFIIFKLQFNFIIVAALLTIIGYSINDTIVVFDRIRENIKSYKGGVKTKEELTEIMNSSMNDVINRNILTTITTIAAVLSLMILGVNEIFTFNIALLIGLIGGAISSIFFAPNLWLFLESKNIGKIKKKKTLDEIDEMSIKGINS